MRITYLEQLVQRVVIQNIYCPILTRIRMCQIRSGYHSSYLTVGVAEAFLTCLIICKTKATVRHFGALKEKKDVCTLSSKGKSAKQTFLP